MPGWDQGFGHSRISGYKQHFKEVFYSDIPQSRAKVQNGSIPRGSLVHTLISAKTAQMYFRFVFVCVLRASLWLQKTDQDEAVKKIS